MLLGALFVMLVYYVIVSTYKNNEIIYNFAYVDNIINIYKNPDDQTNYQTYYVFNPTIINPSIKKVYNNW